MSIDYWCLWLEQLLWIVGLCSAVVRRSENQGLCRGAQSSFCN